MDKKIFGIALIATMAVAVSWNLKLDKNDNVLSKLTLDNIEAIANNESEYDCPRGKVECVRIIVGGTAHIFTKP